MPKAFDIDGILVNFIDEIFLKTAYALGEKDIEELDRTAWRLSECFNLKPSTVHQIFNSDIYFDNMATASVDKRVLAKVGKNDILLTARSHDYKTIFCTNAWRQLHGIENSIVFCTAEKKVDYCLCNGFDTIIDDKADTLKTAIDCGLNVCSIKYDHNKDLWGNKEIEWI